MTNILPPNPPGQSSAEYGRPAPVPAPATNGFAIASLVLGVLGCIPLLGGLLAVIFGLIGIRKARNPAVGGRGMAVAGLVLGLLSLVAWGVSGSLGIYSYFQSKPAIAVAQQFLRDVSANNIPAAANNAQGFSTDQLTALNAQLTAYGTFQDVHFHSFSLQNVNGQTIMQLGGIAHFSHGLKTCDVSLLHQNQTYKVTKISFH